MAKENEETEQTARDCVVIEGINARGFGTVPKAVMRDSTLPVEAKGIYAYLCSFAGGGQTAFPSRATMLSELGLSKDRFYKYRAMLEERGLLRVERRSSGAVARPVRTNVYILSASMPTCYREPAVTGGRSKAGSTEPEASTQENPQVTNDVLETRTSRNGFPQSAGHEQRPGFKDVLETRTTNRPENKDIHCAAFPRPSGETSPPIKNRLIGTEEPSVQEGCIPPEVAREFDALAAPSNTPNRNRIREALRSYGDARKRFPASVIAAAWNRRQQPARDDGRLASYYPQLARWLEDPGPEGANAMCEQERHRQISKLSDKLVLALSLDDEYMARQSAARDLSKLEEAGIATTEQVAELASIRREMKEIRAAKLCELSGTADLPGKDA